MTDSKSLYDILELRWVRDTLRDWSGKCRWIPHDAKKGPTKAASPALMKEAKSVMLVVLDEGQELEKRRQH
eukprot:4184552-Amphidinium_carterae.1